MPLDKCVGCGRPAFEFWPPNQMPIIRFCGTKECLGHLVEIWHKIGIESDKAVYDRAFTRIQPRKELADLQEEILNRIGKEDAGKYSFCC